MMTELCRRLEQQIASSVSQIAVSERPQEIEILTRRTEMLEAHAEYYSKVSRSNFRLGLDGYNSSTEHGKAASLNQSRVALLWTREGDAIRCNLCPWRCAIPQANRGICQARLNNGGTLYATNYGMASTTASIHLPLLLDPIEKRPLFHYKPGSYSLSVASLGCNFKCQFCDHYDMDHRPLGLRPLDPTQIVQKALALRSSVISYTYNEPTIFLEYALDVAREAEKSGLENAFITNGYVNSEAIDLVSRNMQAAVVGVKGSLNPGLYERILGVRDVEPIRDALTSLVDRRIHVEICDLLVTDHGDSIEDVRDFAEWIYDELGPEIPLHLTRYYPDWKLNLPETRLQVLEEAYEEAKKAGLAYVYVVNVPGHRYANTYCPDCHTWLLKRRGSELVGLNLKEGRCPVCGLKIPIRW